MIDHIVTISWVESKFDTSLNQQSLNRYHSEICFQILIFVFGYEVYCDGQQSGNGYRTDSTFSIHRRIGSKSTRWKTNYTFRTSGVGTRLARDIGLLDKTGYSPKVSALTTRITAINSTRRIRISRTCTHTYALALYRTHERTYYASLLGP